MIALPHAMPYIRIGTSNLVLCQPDWISKTLTKAATGTDLPVWIAEDISRGVQSYLTNHYEGTVIEPEELFARIERTLTSLGLNEVARNMDKSLPPVRISLNEIARRAGAGYELAFFHLLAQQIESAAIGGATQIEIYGMKGCALYLSSAKRWTERCQTIKDEITAFLEHARSQVKVNCAEMSLSIAQ